MATGRPVSRAAILEARIYTGDVPKRLKTYRLEPADCTDFAWAVGQTGDTESDVLRAAIRAYIQRVRMGLGADSPPVSAPSVYTHPESPERYEEPPSAPACKHPVASVDELGMCHECDTEVW